MHGLKWGVPYRWKSIRHEHHFDLTKFQAAQENTMSFIFVVLKSQSIEFNSRRFKLKWSIFIFYCIHFDHWDFERIFVSFCNYGIKNINYEIIWWTNGILAEICLYWVDSAFGLLKFSRLSSSSGYLSPSLSVVSADWLEIVLMIMGDVSPRLYDYEAALIAFFIIFWKWTPNIFKWS